jgi:mRNA-degrading endonuclease RelE of RelBE toxin-antitoxin system
MTYKVELSEKTAKFLDKLQSKHKNNFEIIIEHLRVYGHIELEILGLSIRYKN